MSTVLVINSGSSSIKYQLIDPADGAVLASGLVERIGETTGNYKHVVGGSVHTEQGVIADHGVGLRHVLDLFAKHGPSLAKSDVVAVGHRVVQGGKHFSGPALIDDAVVSLIEELVPLGPLHNPAHLKGIEVARELFPRIPQVAVFDTAFFQGLPDAAATYALDQEVAEKYSIRRYGAHGTSHQYVSERVSDILDRQDLRQIVLHLGNGASASAVVNGHAVETSMGLTPLEGLVMGTRTGDIDPATVFHLHRVAGMSMEEIDTLFNKRSGLKGLVGENDMRVVRDLALMGDPAAKLALEVYVHRLKKYIGAYTAIMGGVDAIAFTAGVGENSPVLRAEVLEGMSCLGIELDLEANASQAGGERIISTPDSGVAVLVVPTNEELEIARQAVALLG
ncbi:MAG TPA: acetate kinase [Actinomycetales bacterium]|nr:acetate kinase [Actinomycetales bacterium]